MSTTLAEPSLRECREMYVGFYQESADFFNALVEQNGSLAQSIEKAALVGGLAVHSTLDRRIYNQQSITGYDGSRACSDPFSTSLINSRLGDNVKAGAALEDHSVFVLLPDKGEFNRRYVSNPRLRVHERRVGQAISNLTLKTSPS